MTRLTYTTLCKKIFATCQIGKIPLTGTSEGYAEDASRHLSQSTSIPHLHFPNSLPATPRPWSILSVLYIPSEAREVTVFGTSDSDGEVLGEVRRTTFGQVLVKIKQVFFTLGGMSCS